MPDYSLPFTASNPLVEAVRASPTTWFAIGLALAAILTVAVHGLLSTIRHARAQARARRTAPPDTTTQSIDDVRKSNDYRAATAGERATLDALAPRTRLVHEKRFERHATALARETIGPERCSRWPYRNIDIEQATDDLRASCASIRLASRTYYYTANGPSSRHATSHDKRPR